MTIKDLRKIKRLLEKAAIKPYKGFYGLNEQGLFEIKNESQFKKLRAG